MTQNPDNSNGIRREEVISKVQGFLAQERPDGIGAAQENTNLFELGILDSLLIVSLVVFVEDEFACSLDYDELTEENLCCLSAIADLVVRKAA